MGAPIIDLDDSRMLRKLARARVPRRYWDHIEDCLRAAISETQKHMGRNDLAFDDKDIAELCTVEPVDAAG